MPRFNWGLSVTLRRGHDGMALGDGERCRVSAFVTTETHLRPLRFSLPPRHCPDSSCRLSCAGDQ